MSYAQHQELVDAIRRDILAIGSIYRTIGETLFDEATTRLAERTAATAERHCADERGDLLEACKAALRITPLCGVQSGGGQHAFRAMDERSQIEHQIKAAIAKAESGSDDCTVGALLARMDARAEREKRNDE